MRQDKAVLQLRSPARRIAHAGLALAFFTACATGGAWPAAHRWAGGLVAVVLMGWGLAERLSRRGPRVGAARLALVLGPVMAVLSGLALHALTPAGTGVVPAGWRALHVGLTEATLVAVALHLALLVRARLRAEVRADRPGGPVITKGKRRPGASGDGPA